MGSVGITVDQDVATKNAVADYLNRYTSSHFEVLASSWQNTGDGRYGEWSYVLYQAVRNTKDGSVSAWVTLAGRRSNRDGTSEVYIKALDETVGPVQSARVPHRLLAMLTPTDSQYANQWRTRAAAWHDARRVGKNAVGCTVEFAEPFAYPGESTRTRWLVVSDRLFRTGDLGDARRFRAPREWWTSSFTVVDWAGAAA